MWTGTDGCDRRPPAYDPCSGDHAPPLAQGHRLQLHKADKLKKASTMGDSLARPEYTGDKGEIPFEFVRDTPIEKKPVATFSYGQRIRIAALTERFDEFVEHVI